MIQMFSMYDKQAARYSQPVFARSEAEAVRSAKLEVNRVAEDNTLYRYPGEFELWCVGQFSERDGTVSGDPRFVLGLEDLVDPRVQS